jgi:programmed cell death 8 (apoptosis-inducing factor)
MNNNKVCNERIDVERVEPLAGISKSEPVPTTALDSNEEKGIPATAFFKELPTNNTAGPLCVPMIIVGGGTAAWSALEAIYEKNPTAQVCFFNKSLRFCHFCMLVQVLVVTEEPYAPYNRTPLSKEMWSIPSIAVS